MIFRPVWILRLFFPTLFIGLFAYDFFRLVQGYFPFQSMTLFDWFMFALEIFIFYNMLFFLSVRYEIANDDLVVHSFLFRKKHFKISKILFVEEEGMFSKIGRSGLGSDCATIHFDGGKKLNIIGLSEHYRFIQLLKGKSA